MSFPIVGIGASAGGLAAFESFFRALRNDTGMAFVVVQHLSPDHPSDLAKILRAYTAMPVAEVTDGVVVMPNCVYVIPPAHDLALMGLTLHLFEPALPAGHRRPVDFFFRSLAADLGDRAIAIILSGTGDDGTNGIRAIKSEGGLVIAESESSNKFVGMPHSAIETGLVDHVLPPEAMGPALDADSPPITRARARQRAVSGRDPRQGLRAFARANGP